MKRANILVADDDPRVIVFIEDQLENLGHYVTIARNGKEALEKVQENKPDLIVLDVMMPEMDGYEACDRLKSAPETKDIPILMLTAKGQSQDKVTGFRKGADHYLPKPYDKAEFEARVTALLKRSTLPPFDPTRKDSVFSISLKPEQCLNIRVNGEMAFHGISDKELHLKTDLYARRAVNTYALFDNTLHSDRWRCESQDIGEELYHNIFSDHPEIFSTYHRAVETVTPEERLHFRFEADRDFLRVPLEFLYTEGNYLVLSYPLTRAMSGVRVRKKPLSPDFFNELWSKNEDLKILLIASNTKPQIPGVDHEIASLQASIKTFFEDRSISVKLKTIQTEQATYKTVREELRSCYYHIVHYAGHGNYDANSPEKSYLTFWEQPNQQGNVIPMPVSELQILLRNSEVRFIYLSCCLGTATGEPAKLLDDDFLGIADGLVHAGVPSVLGFRYPVSDSGAETLAQEFYKSLAEQGQIDTALLHARCEIAAKDRDDMTWVSPILIMQG